MLIDTLDKQPMGVGKGMMRGREEREEGCGRGR